MTWTADDRQLVVACDGAGWPVAPRKHYYSSRLFTASGSPKEASFHEVSSYPDIPLWNYIQGSVPPYYALSMLAVDERIYQFLSTCSHWFGPNPMEKPDDVQFNGAKLIYSADGGRTWRNQDGSTPVVRESYRDQSRANLAFFHEPQNAFSLLSFLQMGKGYQDNRDGYVYVYSPNGTTEGTMNELVMFRVPKALILVRAAYEYFAGIQRNGRPVWVKDMGTRSAVHTFPKGWVPAAFPLAWQPSIAYNAPQQTYMMVCSNSLGGDVKGPKPTYLGIWVAAKPWGPWGQIHEETAWLPGADSVARAGWPQIAPKWIAADGKSFWLVWTEAQSAAGPEVTKSLYDAKTEDDFRQARRRWRECHPYFAFNTQRVDLKT
jgi:hypothetical protein